MSGAYLLTGSNGPFMAEIGTVLVVALRGDPNCVFERCVGRGHCDWRGREKKDGGVVNYISNVGSRSVLE